MAQLTQHATQLVRELLLQPGIPPFGEEAMRLALSQVQDHHHQMGELLALAAHRQRRQQRHEAEEREAQEADKARRRRQQEQAASRRDQQQEDGGGQGAAAAAAAAAAEEEEEEEGGAAATQRDAPPSAAPSQQQQPPPEDADANAASAAAAPDWQRHPELAGAVLIHHEAIMRLKRVLLTYCKVRADRLAAVWWQGRRLPEAVSQNLSPAERQFFREHDAAMRRYMGRGPGGLREDLTLDAHPPRDAVLAVRVLRDHGAVRTSTSSSVPLVRGSVHCLALGEAEPLIRLGVLEALD
jgi:hypothetical protein